MAKKKKPTKKPPEFKFTRDLFLKLKALPKPQELNRPCKEDGSL